MYKAIIASNEQKIHEVDMVVRKGDCQVDIFTAEDNPFSASSKVVFETIKKNQDRRVVTLEVIKKKISR